MYYYCSILSGIKAPYRRASFLAKYLQSKHLMVACTGPLQLTSHGVLRPEKCIVASLSVPSHILPLTY